jgi:hypothetical protein
MRRHRGLATFMHQLRFAIERRPGAVRRTLRCSGPGTTSAFKERLGLSAPSERHPSS